MKTNWLLLLSAAVPAILAHPGGHEALSHKEITRRAGLSKRCEASAAVMNMKRWENNTRSIASRSTTSVVINTEAPYYDVLQNDTCILVPDTTAGTFIWPSSQTLRQDMSEGQPGIPLYLDIGVLDITTCEPLENALVDLWHSNATGQYSSFEGYESDTAVIEALNRHNLTKESPELGSTLPTGNSTFLRGMWPTDDNGVMEMKTIFPGFYAGRTIHIHVQVHTNWFVRHNGTIVSQNSVSVGEVFFAEEITQQIMSLPPYNARDFDRITNSAGMLPVVDTRGRREANILTDGIFANASASVAGWDPVMKVVPLDDEDITQGMVAYMTLGVDSMLVSPKEVV